MHNIRLIILVMLFQLFSPSISALVTATDKGGDFLTLCTIQGYQQVLVDKDTGQDDTSASNCIYCLLTLGTLDVFNLNKSFAFSILETEQQVALISHRSLWLNNFFDTLPIRAPPLFG